MFFNDICNSDKKICIPCIIDKYIRKFLNNKFQPKIPVITVPKLDFYASLPYARDAIFFITVTNIIKKHFHCICPKIILKNPKSIGSLFKFKDKVPKLMRSLVIYKHSCPRCNLGTYLGSTKRMLKVRIDSHQGVSHRTGCSLSKKEFSNIREHANKCKTNLSYDDFEILTQAKDETSLLILESLYIKQLVPPLNDNSSSAPLYIA